MPCFVNQALTAMQNIPEENKESLLREVFKRIAKIDFSLSPPEMARDIFDIIEVYLPDNDFYFDIKKKSNRYILNLEDDLRMKITEASDPFMIGLHLAIAGNIIDFGAKNDFSDQCIHAEIKEALEIKLDKTLTDRFQKEIMNADKILYLGDNAGEIIFDKLFIEQLPLDKITFVVRGSAIINDALMADAEMVGMTELVKVVSNGDNIPGTVLHRCSNEFKTLFEESDLIISKGQGNYETLSGIDKNICFLLKAKCPVIAKDLNRKVGDFIIKFST
jgi:uncharacterized protein with ATP-grasp and redox domains